MMKKGSIIILLFLSGFLLGPIFIQTPSVAFAATVNYCPPLADNPNDTKVTVTAAQASSLPSIISSAKANTTIFLEDGTYRVSTLYFRTPNVTLKSKSGNRDNVILDGNYQTGEIVYVAAANVTIANLTITKSKDHGIHVVSGGHYVMLYNLRLVDEKEQFIKINPDGADYADYGTLACSFLELTDAGRTYLQANPTPGFDCYTGGLDAHQSQGWSVRDNIIKNIYCTNGGLPEHGVHFWNSSRDPIVERNIFINDARAIGFGLGSGGGQRIYSDNPLAGSGLTAANVQHIGGTIRNNFILGNISQFDTGIGLEQAWNVNVFHNTIYATKGYGIDIRFPNSNPSIKNNLSTPGIDFRDSASARENTGNIQASASMFVDPNNGNLHLVSTATTAINKGVSLSGAVPTDIDGDARDSQLDVGADEYVSGSAIKVGDLNNDNKVDIFDYNLLVGNFGKTGTGIVGDIDNNGKVDIFDYNLLVGNFGK